MSNESHGKSDVTPTESKTTGTVGNFPHGSRETPVTSVSCMEADRSEKARGHNSDMNVTGESHSFIVPEKPANKGGVPQPTVGGGKGTDQGEHRAIATGPDTEPELGRDTVRSQVAWIAGCTCTFCTSTSTVRTVCGSSARTDLCGGRSAMTVPTAINRRQTSGDAR